MLKFPTLRRGLKLEIWLCSAICPLRGFQEFRVHHIYIYVYIYIDILDSWSRIVGIWGILEGSWGSR